MNNIELFWSHVMNIELILSHVTEHMTNTATVLRFVFIGTTPSAAFANASDLVGNAKWLRLPRFNGYLGVCDDCLPFT